MQHTRKLLDWVAADRTQVAKPTTSRGRGGTDQRRVVLETQQPEVVLAQGNVPERCVVQVAVDVTRDLKLSTVHVKVLVG